MKEIGIKECVKNPLKPCKICGTSTRVVCGIDFTAVPICQDCSLTITAQEVASWTNIQRKRRLKGI